MGLKFYNNTLIQEEIAKKDLPLDDQNYTLLKYQDFLVADNNKKIKVKILVRNLLQLMHFSLIILKNITSLILFLKTHNGSS